MAIRLLIVDDQEIIRQGLRSLLEGDHRFEIIAEAANGNAGVDMAKSLRPDIVLMDISMPGMDGIAATRAIRAECPGTKILAISIRIDKPALDSMLMAGASGFLSKSCSQEELTHALHSIMSGHSYLSPEIARIFMAGYVEMAQDEHRQSPLAALTPGETDVLKLIAEGKSTKEIAVCLELSIKTVETRRKSIMEKTGRETVAELVKLAIRSGLSELES